MVHVRIQGNIVASKLVGPLAGKQVSSNITDQDRKHLRKCSYYTNPKGEIRGQLSLVCANADKYSLLVIHRPSYGMAGT